MPEIQERTTIFELAQQAASYIQQRVPYDLKNPEVGIICGSGLGGLVDTLEASSQFAIPYSDIPEFPQSTVVGHAGKLVFGFLGEKTPVVVMVGRAHFYEGRSIEKVTFPTRVMKLLGITSIIVTNAAGGLNPEYRVGDIMIINDHLNIPGLAGNHPLRGPNEEGFGTRFPALSDAYDLEFRRVAHLAYRKLEGVSSSRKLREGVYAFVSGPTFETRAECRMLQILGADVVGMSTVPEICVARHAGLRVLAMSLVTNCAVLEAGPRGDSLLVENVREDDLNKVLEVGKANHQEVLEAGIEAATDMQALVKQFIDDIAKK
ncbi:inosine/guanosine/xanthosine phosphorylase [Trichophaea hybrida]|nr:inosine/guanosine/xanthosine phosphorylase [Trichophaea hybrida]